MVKEPVDRFVKAEHESLSCSFFSRLYTLTQNGHGASWLAYQCRTRANVSPGLFQGCRPWPKVGGQEASQWVCQRRTWGRTPLQREGLLTWTSYLPVQHIHILPASTTHTHGQTIFVNGIPADNDINSYNFLKGRSVDLNLLHLSITHTLGQTILSTASLLTMTSTAMTSYREGLLTWTSCIFLQHTHMVRLFLSTACLLTMTSAVMTS